MLESSFQPPSRLVWLCLAIPFVQHLINFLWPVISLASTLFLSIDSLVVQAAVVEEIRAVLDYVGFKRIIFGMTLWIISLSSESKIVELC